MDKDLNKLINIYLANKKYFSNVIWSYRYCDEPQINTFNIFCKNLVNSSDGISLKNEPHSSGSSFDVEKALIKVIGEIIERYSCASYKQKAFKYASYSQLSDAVNPQLFSKFTKKTIQKKPGFNVKIPDKFYWSKGKSFIDDSDIYIPAQLVYSNYRLSKNEKIIEFSSSNGAAAGFSIQDAVYRGIMELIEREAFLIYYLNKIKTKHILLNSIKSKNFKEIYKKIKKYNLTLKILDISTDLKIPTYLAIIIDATKVGMPISFGTKADFSDEAALIGSMEEALQVRSWIRNLYEVRKNKYKINGKEDIHEIHHRGIYWYNQKLIKTLDFFLNSEGKKFNNDPFSKKNTRNKIFKLKEIMEKNGIDIYYVDVTFSGFKKNSYRVVKTLSPQIMPLYFSEKYPYLNCERLYEVPVKLGYFSRPKEEKDLNPIPHPFL